jgi:Prolyl oligopeptidase family
MVRMGSTKALSPIRFVDLVQTPTLLLSGALDKNTPAPQALEFYTGLIEQGVEAVLVTYPRDGHRLRRYYAYIDTAARILIWFERHLNRERCHCNALVKSRRLTSLDNAAAGRRQVKGGAPLGYRFNPHRP